MLEVKYFSPKFLFTFLLLLLLLHLLLCRYFLENFQQISPIIHSSSDRSPGGEIKANCTRSGTKDIRGALNLRCLYWSLQRQRSCAAAVQSLNGSSPFAQPTDRPTPLPEEIVQIHHHRDIHLRMEGDPEAKRTEDI